MLGSKILELRKNNHYSQETLSELLDVTRQTISNWETNLTIPDAYQILKISKVFNISLDELMNMDEVLENPKLDKFEELCDRVLFDIKNDIKEVEFESWFNCIKFVEIIDDKLFISVPYYIQEKVLKDRYKKYLLNSFNKYLKNKINDFVLINKSNNINLISISKFKGNEIWKSIISNLDNIDKYDREMLLLGEFINLDKENNFMVKFSIKQVAEKLKNKYGEIILKECKKMFNNKIKSIIFIVEDIYSI